MNGGLGKRMDGVLSPAHGLGDEIGEESLSCGPCCVEVCTLGGIDIVPAPAVLSKVNDLPDSRSR